MRSWNFNWGLCKLIILIVTDVSATETVLVLIYLNEEA